MPWTPSGPAPAAAAAGRSDPPQDSASGAKRPSGPLGSWLAALFTIQTQILWVRLTQFRDRNQQASLRSADVALQSATLCAPVFSSGKEIKPCCSTPSSSPGQVSFTVQRSSSLLLYESRQNNSCVVDFAGAQICRGRTGTAYRSRYIS